MSKSFVKHTLSQVAVHSLEVPVSIVDDIMLKYERSGWARRLLFWQILSTVLVVALLTTVTVRWLERDVVDYRAIVGEPVKLLLKPEFALEDVDEVVVQLPAGVRFVSRNPEVQKLDYVTLDLTRVDDFAEIPIIVEAEGPGVGVLTLTAFDLEERELFREQISIKFEEP